MRIKLIRAPSMNEAMAMLRAELGDDALILGSRRVGAGVELTAALDPLDSKAQALEPFSRVVLPPSCHDALASHGVPPAVMAQISGATLEDALGQFLRFGSLDWERLLMAVGPPGAGKTMTIAKLATRLVMQGDAPLVITTDGERAGAAEQLAAFTRMLNLILVVADHPVALARALASRRPGVKVLIDMPGIDPFNESAADELQAASITAQPAMVLVMPAGLDVSEATDLAMGFAALGVRHLVPTRLDVSRRLGAVVAAAAAAGLTLTDAGVGPGAADGLIHLTPGYLAQRMSQFIAARIPEFTP
jgi:flagellar biosynthesis protein FlhF